MGQPTRRQYPAEFTERAVNLAVESEQSMAQTARALGVHANPLHTWLGQYHRLERQAKEGHDEHLYEALKRLRKEHARLKEEREIVKKAAASLAPPRPCRTPGYQSSMRRFRSVVCVGSWRSHAGATTSGDTARPALRLQPISSGSAT